MLLLLLVQAALAGPTTLGVGLDLVADLPDPSYGSSHAALSLGSGLRVPVRFAVGDSAWIRATAGVLFTGGHDRVEWTDRASGSRVYSDDHWTMVTAGSLMAGPEVGMLVSDKVMPYLGADLGGQLVHNWHSFGGVSAVLLDPATNDLDNPNNIDPHTAVLAPSVGAHVGLKLLELAPFAIDVEAGYTVSFLRETALENALPELNAVRVAYGLNALKVGVAASFDL